MSECILSDITPNGAGYCYIRVRGRGKVGVHVLALERKLGRRLFPGMVACHTCDVKNCHNEEHLFEGTQLDNLLDAKRKGRMATGDRNGSRTHPERLVRGDQHPARLHPEFMAHGSSHCCAKVTEADVAEIDALRASGMRLHEIGSRFGIAHTTVRDIVLRITWKHVPKQVAVSC